MTKSECLALTATFLVLSSFISLVFNSSQLQVATNSSSSSSINLIPIDGFDHDENFTDAPYHWNEHGCQEWPIPKKQHLTGLVVTLLFPSVYPEVNLAMREMICKGSIHSLRQNLLNPQGWDILLIFAHEPHDDTKVMTLDEAADCLQLMGSQNDTNFTLQTWENLDGTNLTTRAYRLSSSKHTVFLAESQISYPQYIQNNLTLLQNTIDPPACRAPSSYIQGTRWYTHEMLELGILQEYDYFAKIDTDMWVMQPIPFDILWDLQLRNALLLHSAQLSRGDDRCASGILEAIYQFQEEESSLIDGWNGRMCSEGQWQVQRDIDLYYTNFVVGRVDFWQSPAVRAFGTF